VQQIGWNLNYAGIASMWRGGCIIKVGFTPPFRDECLIDCLLSERLPERHHSSISEEPWFGVTFVRWFLHQRLVVIILMDAHRVSHEPPAVHKAQPGWRRVIAQAVLWGIPTPAFSTALAFFDGYRSEIVPANLIQAQVMQCTFNMTRFDWPVILARLLRCPYIPRATWQREFTIQSQWGHP